MYIVSQSVFVGKCIDFRNMHRMRNMKFVNFFILLAALTWCNLYDTKCSFPSFIHAPTFVYRAVEYYVWNICMSLFHRTCSERAKL